MPDFRSEEPHNIGESSSVLQVEKCDWDIDWRDVAGSFGEI